jgi:tetratricopeptide (TPR) repeat protein
MMDKSTSNKKNFVDHSTLDVKGNLHIGDVTYIINEKKVTIPHLLTNNIPSNAGRILGRDKELATIATHLAQNLPTVLVNGIGGIGKTSVAAKYVATFGNSYKHLAWLTVQSSLVEAFTNDIVLLKSLHIEQDVRQLIETQRLTDAFKLVVHQLNTLENTLVVLDNANDVADLMDNKNLFDTAKCHYLITSRTQPQEWTIVPIDVLSEDEAVALFRKIAPSVSPDPKGENASLSPLGSGDEALKSLLSKLFYHTLLIELVAKAIENAGFSFEELQTMVETQFIHDENLNEDIVPTGKHGDNYEAKRAKIEEYIWLIFSNVKDLGDDAKQILRGMALLPVATPFDRDFLKTHLAMFEVKDIVPNLSLLVEWGWLEKEQNKKFKMHPLIADVIVKELKVNVVFSDNYIWKIAKLIHYDNVDPNDNLFEKKHSEPLAERLVYLFYLEYTEGLSRLLQYLSWYNTHFGNYEKAVDYGERALEIAIKLPDLDKNILPEFQNTLAIAYKHIERYNDAATLLEDALSVEERNIENNHSLLTRYQSNLALVYQSLRRYYEASKLLEQALMSDKSILGEDHPKVAIRKSNLASVYRDLGRYEEAIVLLKKVLANNIEQFGNDHSGVASDQWGLATVYVKVDKKIEAKALLQLAYENSLKNFGAKHPKTIQIQTSLSGLDTPPVFHFQR